MSGSDFLFVPKEEPTVPGAASPDACSGGDTGGSADDDSALLQRKLNAVLESSREGRKSSSQSPEELQQQLNAALTYSQERSREAMDWKGKYTYRGRIRSFSEARGFGFIQCEETMQQFGRDVFVHKFQLQESGAWAGQDVFFEVELNKSGQPQARNLALVNPAEAVWDYSSWYDNSGMYGDQQGYDYNPQVPSRSQANEARKPQGSEDPVTKQKIEEMIKQCDSSARMQEIIEEYGQHFSKRHVVTALYQLGLCRQFDKKSGNVSMHESGSLTRALIDRLTHINASELAADEASNVLWALASLDEAKGHARAHSYAFELGQQARKRFAEFSPSQMATFVAALSRLVKGPNDDGIVCDIVTQFSEYSSGNGKMARFPPEELKTWTDFLQQASQPSAEAGMMPQNMQNMQNMQMQMQMRMGQGMGNMGMNSMGGSPGCGYGCGACGGPCGGCGAFGCGACGCPGANNMQPRMGQQMRPQAPYGYDMNQAGKGMKGMPNMGGKGKDYGGKAGFNPQKGGGGPEPTGPLLQGGNMKVGLPGMAVRGGKGKFDDEGKGKGDKGKGKGKGKNKDGSPGAPSPQNPQSPQGPPMPVGYQQNTP